VASSGFPAAGAPVGGDVPVPEEARLELDRLGRRWRELPLPAAEAGMPPIRAALDDLAARVGPEPVPDLGPGVVIDQLVVLVWDAYAAGRGDGVPDLLAGLRRGLP